MKSILRILFLYMVYAPISYSDTENPSTKTMSETDLVSFQENTSKNGFYTDHFEALKKISLTNSTTSAELQKLTSEISVLKQNLDEQIKSVNVVKKEEPSIIFVIIGLLLTVTAIVLAGGWLHSINTHREHRKKANELFEKVDLKVMKLTKSKMDEIETTLDDLQRLTKLGYLIDSKDYNNIAFFNHLSQLSQRPTVEMLTIAKQVVELNCGKLDIDTVRHAQEIVDKLQQATKGSA